MSARRVLGPRQLMPEHTRAAACLGPCTAIACLVLRDVELPPRPLAIPAKIFGMARGAVLGTKVGGARHVWVPR